MNKHVEPELKDQDQELHELLSSSDKIERRILGSSIKMSRLLAAILKFKILSADQAIVAVWFDRLPDQRPDAKSIGVYMYHLREWFKTHNVVLQNEHGVGWWITEADKQKIQNIIDVGLARGPGRFTVEPKTDVPLAPANASPVKTLSTVWPKYKIEKNIPIPGKGAGYPFDEMEVGDSFLDKKSKGTSNVHGSIKCWRTSRKNTEKADWKFITRKVPEGVRVWRIA